MRRVVWLVALLWARGAAADPLFSTPVIGKKARWGGGDRDPALLGLTVDARILGVVDASRLAAWPDREQGIEVREPQLAAGVIGVVAHLRCVPLSFVARADAAEPTRPWIDGPAGARVSAIVDDA